MWSKTINDRLSSGILPLAFPSTSPWCCFFSHLLSSPFLSSWAVSYHFWVFLQAQPCKVFKMLTEFSSQSRRGIGRNELHGPKDRKRMIRRMAGSELHACDANGPNITLREEKTEYKKRETQRMRRADERKREGTPWKEIGEESILWAITGIIDHVHVRLR